MNIETCRKRLREIEQGLTEEDRNYNHVAMIDSLIQNKKTKQYFISGSITSEQISDYHQVKEEKDVLDDFVNRKQEAWLNQFGDDVEVHVNTCFTENEYCFGLLIEEISRINPNQEDKNPHVDEVYDVDLTIKPRDDGMDEVVYLMDNVRVKYDKLPSEVKKIVDVIEKDYVNVYNLFD